MIDGGGGKVQLTSLGAAQEKKTRRREGSFAKSGMQTSPKEVLKLALALLFAGRPFGVPYEDEAPTCPTCRPPMGRGGPC